MRVTFFTAAAMVAVVVGASAPIGMAMADTSNATITNSALTALIRNVDVPKTADPFTVLPSQSDLANKPFVLDLPVSQNRVPGWNYDANEQTLSLHPGSNLMVDPDDLPRRFHDANRTLTFANGYTFLDAVTSKSEYLGTNIFGAVANIKSTARRRYGVIELGIMGLVSTFDSIKLSMMPERARTATQNMRLRVEGVVAPIGGQAISCFNSFAEATFDNPNEEVARTCVVSARISSVKLVDTSTGEVLFDRTRPPAVASEASEECKRWHKSLMEAQTDQIKRRTQLIVDAVCPAHLAED